MDFATLDDVAEHLVGLRAERRRPSYSEIARRIRDLRAARGLPPSEQSPGRSTIYDCFRAGRRRLDIDLVVDIARALGADEAEAAGLESACWAVQHQAEAAKVVSVLADLPAGVEHYVGRGPELAVLTSPDAVRRTFAIEGMAGCGKTQLAALAARRLLARGDADKVVFADLRGYDPTRPPADAFSVLDGILRTLGVRTAEQPRGNDARRELMNSRLAEQRAILVLDDASDEAQVAALLPVRSDSSDTSAVPVFITSRTHLAGLDATTIGLSVFAEEETVDLLRAVLGTARVDADPDAAHDIAAAIGNLPLAANIAATRIAARSEWSLADHRDALSAHRVVHADQALLTALHLSYRALSPEARRALRLLAVQPCREVDVVGLSMLCGLDRDRTADLLADLAAAHVVLVSESGRISLHALVRGHAAEASYEEDRPADRDAALGRLVDYLITCAWAATHEMYGDSPVTPRHRSGPPPLSFDKETAAAWLAAEHENLLTVSAPEHARIRATLAIELSEALGRHLERQGHHVDGVVLHDRAQGSARALEDVRGEGRAELYLGQHFIRLSQPEHAIRHVQRAERLLEEAGDVECLMSAMNVLAIIASHQGEMEKALGYFARALEIAHQTGTETAIALLHDNMAIIKRRLGDLDGALEQHDFAREAARTNDDRDLLATTLVNASEVHLLRGDPDGAIAAATESLAIAQEMRATPVVAFATTNIGMAYTALGRTREAIAQHQEALAIAQRIGSRYLEASVLNNLGEAHLAEEDTDHAAKWFREARNLGEDIGEAFEVARGLAGSGHVKRLEGDFDGAREDWEAALPLLADSGAPEATAIQEALAGLPR